MPIFQDPERRHFYDLWSDEHGEQRNHSFWDHQNHEEDRDQPECDCSEQAQNAKASVDHRDPDLKLHTADRNGLIQYIKRADTSAWGHSLYLNTSPHPSDAPKPIDEYRTDSQEELASPAEIERPRSALHSGDFREGRNGESPQSPIPERKTNPHFSLLSSSPTTPWFNPSLFQLRKENLSTHPRETPFPTQGRSRAPSLGSFSSSYVLKAPTSPLVYQANNTDLDFSPRDHMDIPDSAEKVNRRRTLPPEYFRHLQSSPTVHGPGFGTSYPNRQEFPYQTPQRSTTSAYSLQLASSVQAPSLRNIRPSIAPDASSKSHAPLVGSYEESILRGRMSMNPSKPLDFTAQIGVLGKGKCKVNLKCPPHVSIPFPAVFYSYPTSGSGRSISDDNPSPYVGLIDLDNSLPKDDQSANRRRRRHHSPAGAEVSENPTHKYNESDAFRKREKRNRRAESPKSPPGGCYRIPQHGQLQIMIKNPNKTAVKLFLVPYDLSDMEPGTKTFIRQRSYSAGPILDMPLSARKNYGTDRPEASLNASEDPQDKPILRYLIHLNICCPSKGRYYLHSSIRVVFANRVPDEKEKLRNETQNPDPRYAPYKPNRESKGHLIQRDPFLSSPAPSLRENPFLGNTHFNKLEYDEASHEGIYNKLRKGDAGYGGSPYGSPGSEAGESLLAQRLRGLDVQKHPEAR